MERTHDSTLEDRPKAFDGVGMHGTDHVLPLCVVNDFMGIPGFQFRIAVPLIGHEQTHAIRDGFVHELRQGLRFHISNHASHDISLALNGSSDDGLSRSARSPEVATATFAFVFVLRLPTDIRFINLDNAAQFGGIPGGQRYTNTMAHIPRSFVRAKAHITADLQGTHALLARQHQVGDLKPIHQRFIRVLKDRARNMRKAIGRRRRAGIALPMPRIALQFGRIRRAATWTLHAIRPTLAHQVSTASIFIWEGGIELLNRQLMQEFARGHDCVSSVERSIA